MPYVPHDDATSDATSDNTIVAGLGASAGGVEALEAFFAGLPEIDGVAFVVILHLAPDEESRLADVLQGGLPLPVVQVTEAVDVEAGHVYVIPPNRNLLAADGRLVLEPIEAERVRRRPVDHFFRTLAEAYGARAVGVVLSGTGANGSVGVRALKEAGGLILAQDPADARFGEMPRTAIAMGVVDAVGSAGALAAEVVAYAHRIQSVHLPAPEALPEDGVKALQGVLAQLRARTGHDFAHYKRATVLRRLDRRLHVTGAASLTEYLDRLRGDAAEAEALLDDLLISVTQFFRDREAFAALARAVPQLFEGKGPDGEVRVWVPGCATGEEGVLHRHAALGARRDARRAAPRPGVRHRPLRARRPDGARRRLPRVHRGRREPGAAPALLRPRKRALPRRRAAARGGPVRAAQRARGPAVLAAGPGELPERADLLPARLAAARARRVPLRAAPGRAAAAGLERVAGRGSRAVRLRRQAGAAVRAAGRGDAAGAAPPRHARAAAAAGRRGGAAAAGAHSGRGRARAPRAPRRRRPAQRARGRERRRGPRVRRRRAVPALRRRHADARVRPSAPPRAPRRGADRAVPGAPPGPRRGRPRRARRGRRGAARRGARPGGAGRRRRLGGVRRARAGADAPAARRRRRAGRGGCARPRSSSRSRSRSSRPAARSSAPRTRSCSRSTRS